MKKITLAESRTTNWSGGTSTELWIDPPGSSYAARDFDYRISTATIEADESTFTPLPGFDRILAVLTNEIALDINDESRVLQPGELLHFRGEDAVRSAGRTRDFNLISRRGKPVNCFQLEGEVKGPALVFDKTDLSLTILDSGERVEFGPCIVIELETIQLPESIRTVVAGMRSEPVGVGMTTARVIRYSDDYKSYYLKVDSGAEIRNEKRRLDFLHGKLPVPEVIGYIEGETSYLLTTAMQGEMAFLADRQAALRNLSGCGDIGQLVGGVAGGFDINHFRVWSHRPADRIQVTGIDTGHFHAELVQGMREKGESAAIHCFSGDNVITTLDERPDGGGDGPHARGGCQSCFTILQQCQFLFDGVQGRVAQAGIDVTSLLKRKTPAALLGVIKYEGRCLMDRRGKCSELVMEVPTMDLPGGETHLF